MARSNRAAASRRAAKRYTPQVRAESRLRFGSPIQQLHAALEDAVSQYNGTVAAAQTGAAGIRTAADRAKPELRKASGSAARVVEDTHRALAQSLSQAQQGGSVGKLLASATTGDAESTRGRIAESLASSLKDTTMRKQDAAAGAAYATSNARATLESDRRKLQGQLTEISGQRGAFTQQRLAQLVDADQKARAEDRRAGLGRRNTRIVAGVDPHGRPIPGSAKAQELKLKKREAARKAREKAKGGKLPDGVKPLETAGQNSVKSGIEKAIQVARRLSAQGGYSRSKLASLMLTGRESQKVIDPRQAARLAKAHPDWTASQVQRAATLAVPSIPSFDSHVVSAALDVVRDKHLSPATIAKLHRAGVRVNDLGYSTSRPAPRRRPWNATNPGRGGH